MDKHDIRIAFPDNRPFYLSEIKLGYASECRKPTGELIKAELHLGSHYINVKGFDDALDIWHAILEARRRGDKVFNLFTYRRD